MTQTDESATHDEVVAIVERAGPVVRRERAASGVPHHDDEQRRRLAALLAFAERQGWGRS